MFKAIVSFFSSIGSLIYGFLSYKCIQMLKVEIKKDGDKSFLILFSVFSVFMYILCISALIGACFFS